MIIREASVRKKFLIHDKRRSLHSTVGGSCKPVAHQATVADYCTEESSFKTCL